jgi:hypothetical protein
MREGETLARGTHARSRKKRVFWRPRLTKSEPSAAAQQKIRFHRAFTFDVDAAVRLEPKSLAKVSTGCCRDLDAVWQAVRLHSTGDVHRITPDVVDEFVGSYDPGHHVARMNADAHLQGVRQLAIYPLDRLDHRQGHLSDHDRVLPCHSTGCYVQQLQGCVPLRRDRII